MRVFLDTNVLVAAFATRGLCADVMRIVLVEHELLTSSTVTQELTRTLVDKIRLPPQVARELVDFVRSSASIIEAPPRPPPVPVRDPNDVAILCEALAGGADVLVTGDRDLLDLPEVPGLNILDPRGFWELVRLTGR